MGLFNSGKNDKVEKVSKYERHYNVPPNSSRRHSSKHRPHQGEAAARALSQPPLMRMAGAPAGGFYPSAAIFTPGMVGAMPQVRYPMPAFDLSKYASPATYTSNPFAGQMAPMNFPPIWSNGMALVNNRSAYPQGFNDYQQGGWPNISPSNYGYMGAMQF